MTMPYPGACQTIEIKIAQVSVEGFYPIIVSLQAMFSSMKFGKLETMKWNNFANFAIPAKSCINFSGVV